MGDSLAASVFSSNLHQHGTLFLFAMHRAMTFLAKCNQVVGMIVLLVIVNMVNMQIPGNRAKRFFAKLARPSVTFSNRPTDFLPTSNVASVLVFYLVANNALYSHFGKTPSLESKLFDKFANSGGGYSALRADVVKRTILLDVLVAKPLSIVILLFRAVMSWRINQPKALLGYPLDGRTATTSAQGRLAWRQIDGLIGTSRASFGNSAKGVAVASKCLPKWAKRTVEFCAYFLKGRIEACRQLSPIVFANRKFSSPVEQSPRIATHVWTQQNTVRLQYMANYMNSGGELFCNATNARPLAIVIKCLIARANDNFSRIVKSTKILPGQITTWLYAVTNDNFPDSALIAVIFKAKFRKAGEVAFLITKLIATTNFYFLFWSEFSLMMTRGMIEAHQKSPFWCLIRGRVQARCPVFLLGLQGYCSTFGLQIQAVGGVA